MFYITLKFNVQKSFSKINLLNVTVSKNNNKLSTNLYTKETNTHQYLHAKSCHDNYIKISVPYGQSVHIKRICSDENFFKAKANTTRDMATEKGLFTRKVRPEIEKVNLTYLKGQKKKLMSQST